MYVYIIYVCVCVCVCVCVRIYKYMCVCVYIYIYIHTHTHKWKIIRGPFKHLHLTLTHYVGTMQIYPLNCTEYCTMKPCAMETSKWKT